MKSIELYKKVGRRYVVHNNYYDETGLPEGLYLLYKNSYKGEHSAMMNMLHYAKVHDIKNVSKFCDMWVAHEEVLTKAIKEGIEEWINNKKGNYTTNELSIIICKALSEI